jgi:endonuclease/exonuclease/phosphatase (EEP) superfamily protein YafD
MHLITLLLLLITSISFLGSHFWIAELLTHFRVQLMQITLPFILFALWKRKNRTASLLLLIALVNYYPVLTLYFNAPTTPAPLSHRALLINLNHTNPNKAATLEKIQTRKTDLIILLEVTSAWAGTLQPLLQTHPHTLQHPREDPFGIAVYSRLPISRPEKHIHAPLNIPTLQFDLHLDQKTITCFATHPPPPISSSFAYARNKQLQALAAHIHNAHHPTLVLGDLNTTPFSPIFQQLLQDAVLKDSTQGFGFQPTWNVSNPLLSLPIDHALHHPHIQINQRQVGNDIGSDHRPLVIDFHLREV